MPPRVHVPQPGADIDEAAETVKDQLLEGPKGHVFLNREMSMNNFLSTSVCAISERLIWQLRIRK